MTSGLTTLEDALFSFHPRRIDGSARGSGLNATWKITVDGAPAILKTYDTRRSALQTVLTDIGNRLSGLTSYSADSRAQIERQNLNMWRMAGFQTPAIMDVFFPIPPPVPCLAMEFVDAPLLLDVLSDKKAPLADRQAVLARFIPEWAKRHDEAVRRREPRLVQEHATFAHVFVCENRFVSFDLEVSFVRSGDVAGLVAREVIGYLRSLVKRVPYEESDSWLELLVREYPKRELLERGVRDLLAHPLALRRRINEIDRKFLKRGSSFTKYSAASRLAKALMDHPPAGPRGA
ncbi:MAG: hypothetical protein FJ224_06960 [Lentisphaerae bacterium]|nr:hypothetical protein [Lentisphaerota bacterium]